MYPSEFAAIGAAVARQKVVGQGSWFDSALWPVAVLHWFRNFAVNEVHVGSIPIGHLTIFGVVDSVGRIPWFSSRSPRVRFPLTSSKKQVAKVVKTFGSLDSTSRQDFRFYAVCRKF